RRRGRLPHRNHTLRPTGLRVLQGACMMKRHLASTKPPTTTPCRRVYPIAPRVLIASLVVIAAARAHAHPEFQAYVQQNAPRNVDCAMCHAHPDGPEGPKPGQIVSLTPD